MFHNDIHHMESAAERLSQMLPAASRDDVSVSTLRRADEMILVVVLPVRLSHLRTRLPAAVDGVRVIYQVSDPLSLN
jgi:hypothetical protein